MAVVETFHVLRISLEGVEPLIWRRVRVSSKLPLAAIHVVFQVAMGWQGKPHYSFQFHRSDCKSQYSSNLLHEEGDYDPLEHILLTELVAKGDTFAYLYEFDHWHHSVVVEDISMVMPASQPVLCQTGAGTCPPLDCGGPAGFVTLRTEGIFDAESFDLDVINMELTEIFGLPDYSKFDFVDDDGHPLPYHYDASLPLDRQVWQKLSREEQLWTIAASHYWLTDMEHRDIDIIRIHAVAHATVEIQAIVGHPPVVAETLSRLLNLGWDRHDIIHAIIDVMNELMETRLAFYDVVPNLNAESAEQQFEGAVQDDNSEYNVELARRLSMLGTGKRPKRN